MTRTWLTAVAAAALLIGLGTAQAREFRAGHILNAQSDQGQAAEHFAKRVGELTNGEHTVRVFHAGELGKSIPLQLESLAGGSQDFFIDTMDYFKAWDDRFGILNTPYVFRDRVHFTKFLASPVFEDMVKALEARGVVFLGKPSYNWIRQTDRGITSRRPIMTPDDLKGVKMRMFQAEVPIKSWAAFGANIQVIPWPDVYTALATGTVDALTGPLAISYLTKHTEVAKYHTNVREYYQLVSPLMSKRSYDRLSPPHKDLMHKAAQEAGDVYIRVSALEKDNDMKAINEHGVTLIVPPIGPWLEKMKPVLVEFENSGVLPKGLVAQVQAIN